MSSKSSKSPKVQTESFFVVGEKIGPKRKQNCKKRTNGKTLNPRRRAFVKKREKERGQESSLKQYKKKKKGVLYAVW